jgi:hypothetical protein
MIRQAQSVAVDGLAPRAGGRVWQLSLRDHAGWDRRAARKNGASAALLWLTSGRTQNSATASHSISKDADPSGPPRRHEQAAVEDQIPHFTACLCDEEAAVPGGPVRRPLLLRLGRHCSDQPVQGALSSGRRRVNEMSNPTHAHAWSLGRGGQVR